MVISASLSVGGAALPSFINFKEPLMPQILNFISSVVEAPYSIFLSNIILFVVAFFIAFLGIVISWIMRHPDRFRYYIKRCRQRPYISKLEKIFRGWLLFLAERFRPGAVYGLSFTISLIILFFAIWIFGGVLEDIFARNGIKLIDAPLAAFIAVHKNYWLAKISWQISMLGGSIFTAVLGIGMGLFLRFYARSWRPFIFLAISAAGASMLDFAVKFLIAWHRNLNIGLTLSKIEGSYFFGPIFVSVILSSSAYLAAKFFPKWRKQVLIWLATLVFIFLISFSRVYLGISQASSVIGSWSLAFLWLAAVFFVENFSKQNIGISILGPVLPQKILSVQVGDRNSASRAVGNRLFKTPASGLSWEQVKKREARGEINFVKQKASRSLAGILKANIFTRFNALLTGLFVVVLFLSGKQDALFITIVAVNTAIGIIQEMKAKYTLDRLRVIITPQARVRRADKIYKIPISKIVIDDVLELRPGDQIPVDGLVLSADNFEVNESILTGESDPIIKNSGGKVLSGSFVVAGSALIQATGVGKNSYAEQLIKKASRFSLSDSELRKGINKILKYVGWIIIPTIIWLLLAQLLYNRIGWRDAVVSSIGGLVGMIPQGLVLLASMVMATAIIRLGKYKALVQELAAVEMLARVDTVLLDKTGTLTTGIMKSEKIIESDNKETLPASASEALGAVAQANPGANPTITAIKKSYPAPNGGNWKISEKIPFSSARKWSATTFYQYGTWVLGAPEIVLKDAEPSNLLEQANDLAGKGKRVLALAYSSSAIDAKLNILPKGLKPAALIVLNEEIRKDVAETIKYFKGQGVDIKIISGDNPRTIAAVASQAGISDVSSLYDARNLPDDFNKLVDVLKKYNLFGRVAPKQKRVIVKALQRRGHTVAMAGDGINDVLAIKEADFGIALGSGAAATRAVAQLILLNNNFSALPHVIAEGRRVIANVERTARLFITKTVYVFFLAIAVGLAQAPFPFLPRHLTLIDFFTIGTPALFLSFSKNTTRARPGFLFRVFRFAFPAGMVTAGATLASYALTRQLAPANIDLARTAATLTLIGCGLIILVLIAKPHTVWQKLMLILFPTLLVPILLLKLSRSFFALALPPLRIWAMIAVLEIICAVIFISILGHSMDALINKIRRKFVSAEKQF